MSSSFQSQLPKTLCVMVCYFILDPLQADCTVVTTRSFFIHPTKYTLNPLFLSSICITSTTISMKQNIIYCRYYLNYYSYETKYIFLSSNLAMPVTHNGVTVAREATSRWMPMEMSMLASAFVGSSTADTRQRA